MADVTDLSSHSGFAFKDTATDELYADIMGVIGAHYATRGVTPTQAVGVLEWAKMSIMITNTDFGAEE